MTANPFPAPASYPVARPDCTWFEEARLPLRLTPIRLLFFVLLASLSSMVVAACPGDAGEPLPPRDQLAALEQELGRLTPACSKQPGFLAYRGAVLNGLGRWAEAAMLLEEALLLDPYRASAQIDYAETLAALGDAPAASALLRELLARPDVPPTLRPELERRLNTVEALQRFDLLSGLRKFTGTGWQGEATVAVRAGYDSNLNSAPSRDALTLTLPGGDAVLLLADRFRARGGTAEIAEASGHLARPLDGGASLQFYGEARARGSSVATGTDYQQAQVVAAWSQPTNTGDTLLSVGATTLHYGGEQLYQALRMAASRDWHLDGCRPRLGLEFEWRRYPAVRELDGRFLGASTGAACLLGLNRLTVAVRAGEDHAVGDRPGGDQRQADMRVAWAGRLGDGSLLADILLTHQQDGAGFSPLLENNARRRLNRLGLHLEYAYPIVPGWAVLATFDTTVQRSNLPLFDIHGHAVYLGLRWRSGR
jgi:hypothetical protein